MFGQGFACLFAPNMTDDFGRWLDHRKLRFDPGGLEWPLKFMRNAHGSGLLLVMLLREVLERFSGWD
jgi:hypothetical protein